jgi:hypothetical protein
MTESVHNGCEKFGFFFSKFNLLKIVVFGLPLIICLLFILLYILNLFILIIKVNYIYSLHAIQNEIIPKKMFINFSPESQNFAQVFWNMCAQSSSSRPNSFAVTWTYNPRPLLVISLFEKKLKIILKNSWGRFFSFFFYF